MVVTLTKRGLIAREPGRARTIRVLVPREETIIEQRGIAIAGVRGIWPGGSGFLLSGSGPS